MSKSIPHDWKITYIGNLCKVGRGSSPRPISDQRYFEGGTIPWIKIADATKSGKYLYETKQKVNKHGASFSRLLPKGSLIIATSGTLGYPQILGVDGCIHDGWLYLDDCKEVEIDFLYYLFRWRQQYFYNMAYGAAIQNVNTMILREMEIALPPLPTQRKIAAILSAYDDLIENNTRRIAILEQMAQLLYREWLVRFRFPGHQDVEMVDSELGPIPAGWEIKHLGSIAKQVRTSVQPNKVDPTTPYIGLGHMPKDGVMALPDWGTADETKSTKLVFKAGEILFGKIRPYFHKVGVAPISGVSSTDAIIIAPKEKAYFSIVLGCVSSKEFVDYATQSSSGTKMPRANWEVLVKYPVPIPPEPLFIQFREIVEDAVALVQSLVLHNRILRRTRDLLLPRLISGEVDVADLEIAV
jgi:type I restriction enzyme S subunit